MGFEGLAPSASLLLVGLLLDAVFGDPQLRFHPIRLMGDTLTVFERLLRRLGTGWLRRRLRAVPAARRCSGSRCPVSPYTNSSDGIADARIDRACACRFHSLCDARSDRSRSNRSASRASGDLPGDSSCNRNARGPRHDARWISTLVEERRSKVSAKASSMAF